MRELNQILKDAEELLKSSEQQAGDGFHQAKEKLEASLKSAKQEIHKIEEVVVKKTKEAAQATDSYVHENPWKTAGIAAGVGLLIGLLIGRNK
ncbi:DUF883 domain-containing protein [Undibacterium sp. FT137W]|uniref:DUF883 domain-containing protein n=2 Tax=Undibacterium fentianense TaxID=2828728 RepID=A0A941E727_9BURK|nr:DUF883 domain-containing protein [Undibacterium fentianense]